MTNEGARTSQRTSRDDESQHPEPSSEIVPAPQAEPPADAGPAETSDATPASHQTINLGNYARRASQQGSSLGFNPEAVIIQPPAPPDPEPTGWADENSITKAELARQLDTSTRTVDRWVNEGILPAPIRPGRGRMSARFQPDAAILYWQEQTEEARKERRAAQRNRKNLPDAELTHESRRKRGRRPGGNS